MTRPEDAFQSQVIDMARKCGWLAVHARSVRVLLRGGRVRWQTPLQGDGVGHPDTWFVRERVFWAELKSETGAVAPAQRLWLEALRAAGQEAYVWTPDDWKQIITVLTRRAP